MDQNSCNRNAVFVSLGAVAGATNSQCQRPGCLNQFPSRSNKRFCSDACRKLADKVSPAYARRRFERAVRNLERKRQHERRRLTLTCAYTPRDLASSRKTQGGVPRALPKKLPELTPESIERYLWHLEREASRG